MHNEQPTLPYTYHIDVITLLPHFRMDIAIEDIMFLTNIRIYNITLVGRLAVRMLPMPSTADPWLAVRFASQPDFDCEAASHMGIVRQVPRAAACAEIDITIARCSDQAE